MEDRENENNILVIEDKQESAQLLEKTITASGYKVWVVHNGQEAIKLIRSTPFLAVITELHMAGMSGLEITRNVLSLSPYVSVIVITAYSFINSAVEAMEAGAYGYITKPFNVAEIRIILERAVERGHLISAGQETKHYAELSAVDGLTGAYNHRSFEVYLKEKIIQMKLQAGIFSMLMVDADNFKKYNDTNGHQAGDELLRNLSKQLKLAIRQGDSVFRYGGEEFAVYLNNATKKSAAIVAERINTLTNLYLACTVSIGVSSFPEDGEDYTSVVGKADAALYQAKEAGKNRYCLA